jgi:hypothetical protein
MQCLPNELHDECEGQAREIADSSWRDAKESQEKLRILLEEAKGLSTFCGSDEDFRRLRGGKRTWRQKAL